MNKYVLDSYSLLAYFGNESGAKIVEQILIEAGSGDCALYCNLINLGEVYYISAREDSVETADAIIARIKRFPVELVQNDERLTLIAARIKAFFRVSYADAFAVATAIDKKAMVLTGDREFKSVSDLVQIRWL